MYTQLQTSCGRKHTHDSTFAVHEWPPTVIHDVHIIRAMHNDVDYILVHSMTALRESLL